MIEITIKAIYQRKRMQRPTATSAQIQITREKSALRRNEWVAGLVNRITSHSRNIQGGQKSKPLSRIIIKSY